MKKIICFIAVAVLLICTCSIPAFADSATISLSKSSITVGSNVTVTVKYKADFAMYGIDATLTYNNSVLQYVSGSGTQSGSSIKFVEGLSGENSQSFSVVFKAIAEGAGSLSFSASASGNGDGSASAGATVNVTAVQPSSNANLSSLKLSEGTLSPAFKAGTTNYSAEVMYDIQKIVISANAAAGDSKVTGAGTFELKVGENKFTLTVTAASGAKKSYTVNIKRLTEEETASAIQAKRDSDPYLIVVNGTDRIIQSDLASILPPYEGFSVTEIERKGAQVSVLGDDHGKYQLFYATDTNGEDGAFYICGSQDDFKRANCLQAGGKLYIVEAFESGINVNPRYALSMMRIAGADMECYKYADGKYEDFCIFNCYINGENGYYRYDSLETTMQREPDFIAETEPQTVKTSTSIFSKIGKMSMQAKMVLTLLVLAALLIIVLIVLMIIRAVSGDDEEEDQTNKDISDESDILKSETEQFSDETQDDAIQEENCISDAEDSAKEPGSDDNIEEIELPDEESNSESDISEFIESEDDF